MEAVYIPYMGVRNSERVVMKLPKKPGRPKKLTPEPPGHENMMAGLRRALAVPKAEIDRREKEWQEKQKAKKGTPKAAEN